MVRVSEYKGLGLGLLIMVRVGGTGGLLVMVRVTCV
jgi:hypothetical protein